MGSHYKKQYLVEGMPVQKEVQVLVKGLNRLLYTQRLCSLIQLILLEEGEREKKNLNKYSFSEKEKNNQIFLTD